MTDGPVAAIRGDAAHLEGALEALRAPPSAWDAFRHLKARAVAHAEADEGCLPHIPAAMGEGDCPTCGSGLVMPPDGGMPGERECPNGCEDSPSQADTDACPCCTAPMEGGDHCPYCGCEAHEASNVDHLRARAQLLQATVDRAAAILGREAA